MDDQGTNNRLISVRFLTTAGSDVASVDMPQVPPEGARVMLPHGDEMGSWEVIEVIWWPALAPNINPITAATVYVEFTGRTLEQLLRRQ